MIITPYDINKYDTPLKLMEEIKKAINSGDTQLIYAREPLHSDYPKEEGIFFLHNKLINLEETSTNNIANTLKEYSDFMKKHKIQVIKEFDSTCSLAYEGEIPHIKVSKFETQPFYGFNKFQIIDGYTLSRNNEKGIKYFKGIDFTYALDSNAVSYFTKYVTTNDDTYRDVYTQILKKENNVDIAPYIFETVMQGLKDFGINYKLNKKNKNEKQAGFFETLKILHKKGIFIEKQEKIFFNKIIKSTNPLIEFYGTLGFQSQIFLLSILEARYKFGKSPNKIKDYVYNELRKAEIPIENRFKAILYLFCENQGHEFFEKVVNFPKINNLEKYMENIDNTGRDIALTLLEKYMYGKLNIYPFLATFDQGLIKMFQNTKPDYIFKCHNIAIPVYKNINKDMMRKHLKFFETDSPKNGISLIAGSFKELVRYYQNKKNEFINLITSK